MHLCTLMLSFFCPFVLFGIVFVLFLSFLIEKVYEFLGDQLLNLYERLIIMQKISY